MTGIFNCPECDSKYIGLLSSLNKIYCHECEKYYPKPLKPGQKSILIKNYKGRGNEK